MVIIIALIALSGRLLVTVGMALVAIVSPVWGVVRNLALPGGTLGLSYVVMALVGLAVLFGAVAVAIGSGLIAREETIQELEAAVARTRAISIEDNRGRFIGIVPVTVTHADGDRPPFLAIPINPADIPSAFWRCAVLLEDRRYDETPFGVDPDGLLRAWWTLFTFQKRHGGSGLREMVARSIRGLVPRPRAFFLNEMSRKWTAWSDAPAMAELFPDENALSSATATILPLVIGAEGSRFGGAVHGLQLAARVLFDKEAAALNDGEALAMAAAINLPVQVASQANAKGLNKARERLKSVKNRATRCLDHGSFGGEGFDTARARTQLAAIQLPLLDGPGVDPRTAPIHPERRAVRALGGAITDLAAELRAAAGPDWRETVGVVRMATSPADLLRLSSDFRDAVKAVERRHAAILARPLWGGPNHALVTGAVVDSRGAIVAQVSNSSRGFGHLDPQPIGSIAKIVASVLRSGDSPATRYSCPSPSRECPNGGSFTAAESFGRSLSTTVFRRLTLNSEAEAQAGFAAFGWPVPPAGSARYEAAYGTIEARPAEVLRAGAMLTGIIAGRPSATPLPHLTTEIVLADGRVVRPAPSVIEPEALKLMLARKGAREFVANVLGAPIRMGTLRDLAPIAKTPGVANLWGKTGTADGANGAVRTVWIMAGFTYHGRQYTALVMVAGSNGSPLGHGFAARAIAPLAATFVKHVFSISARKDFK